MIQNSSYSSKSIITGNKYVALLDILGFKSILENNTQAEVIEYYTSFTNDLKLALSNFNLVQDTKRGQVYPDLSSIKVNSILMSDTLFLWSNEDSYWGLLKLVSSVHYLIELCTNKPKFRYLRGGISYGEFFYLNNGIIYSNDGSIQKHDLLFGKSVMKVDSYEKDLEMIGVVIDDGAINHARESNEDLFTTEWDNLISNYKVIEYDVPFKNSQQVVIEKTRLFTVNWVENHDYTNSKDIRNGFEVNNKKINDSVEIKIKNTLEYFHYVKKLMNPDGYIEKESDEEDNSIKAYQISQPRII